MKELRNDKIEELLIKLFRIVYELKKRSLYRDLYPEVNEIVRKLFNEEVEPLFNINSDVPIEKQVEQLFNILNLNLTEEQIIRLFSENIYTSRYYKLSRPLK